ncbi:MAG: hypothetical protein ACXVEF_05215 [Polyangiales bacterium]
MADGRKKREAGDHKGALADFKAANAIMGVPTTGLELGRTLADLGMLIEARDTLLTVARSTPKPGEPAPFGDARIEAQALADAIAPRIPSIKLVLTGVAEGAQVKVTIDGVVINAATFGVARKANPGTHTIVATLSGVEKKATITLAEQQTLEVPFDFSDTNDAAGPVSPIEAPRTTTTTKTSPLVYAGASVGAAGLIVGSITGVMHLKKTSTLRDECGNGQCPPALHADYDSAKTLSTVSTVSFIVAAVGVGVGIYGLFTPTTVETRQAHCTPWIGIGMVGVSGAF